MPDLLTCRTLVTILLEGQPVVCNMMALQKWSPKTHEALSYSASHSNGNPMKSFALISLGVAGGVLAIHDTSAAVLTLEEYAFNLDGVLTANAFPASVNGAGFDTGTGLGSVQVSVSGVGVHYLGMFVDHEIDEASNTFFNETGTALGLPSAGQSWEVDEPGWVDGDIYDNLTAGTLDNASGASIYGATVFPDDVSMALAHGFVLGAGESAELTFTLGLVPPAGGFYLVHTDSDSDASIYFSSTLTLTNIPEPALAWLPMALAGLGMARTRVGSRRTT